VILPHILVTEFEPYLGQFCQMPLSIYLIKIMWVKPDFFGSNFCYKDIQNGGLRAIRNMIQTQIEPRHDDKNNKTNDAQKNNTIHAKNMNTKGQIKLFCDSGFFLGHSCPTKNVKSNSGKWGIFYLLIANFFATQIIGGTKELVVLL